MKKVEDTPDVFDVGDIRIFSDEAGGYWLQSPRGRFFHTDLLSAYEIARLQTNDAATLIKLTAILSYFKEREEQIHNSINDPGDLIRLTAQLLDEQNQVNSGNEDGL